MLCCVVHDLFLLNSSAYYLSLLNISATFFVTRSVLFPRPPPCSSLPLVSRSLSFLLFPLLHSHCACLWSVSLVFFCLLVWSLWLANYIFLRVSCLLVCLRFGFVVFRGFVLLRSVFFTHTPLFFSVHFSFKCVLHRNATLYCSVSLSLIFFFTLVANPFIPTLCVFRRPTVFQD